MSASSARLCAAVLSGRISLLNPACHQEAAGATTAMWHRRGQDHPDVTSVWSGPGCRGPADGQVAELAAARDGPARDAWLSSALATGEDCHLLHAYGVN